MSESSQLESISAICPCCGVSLDGALNLRARGGPKPNDVSCCAYCASLLYFDDDLALKIMTANMFIELSDILADELRSLVAYIQTHPFPEP